MERAFVLYHSKASSGGRFYRVLLCRIQSDKNGALKWDYKPLGRDDRGVVELIKKNGVVFGNIKIDDGKVKGYPASLDRYTDEGVLTILSQIETQEGVVKGYKVCNTAGKVSNIQVEKLCQLCKEYNAKKGKSLITNGIFVDKTAEKKAHIKAYEEGQFIVEKLNGNAKKKVVAQEEKRSETSAVDVDKPGMLERVFTKPQIEQLVLGKSKGLNVKVYAKPDLSPEQMAELRKGLEKGVDVSLVANSAYGIMEMRTYIMDLKDGLDIRPYLSSKYSAEQICELSLASELGLDISKMLDPRLTPSEMADIRQRLESGFWGEQFSIPVEEWKEQQK